MLQVSPLFIVGAAATGVNASADVPRPVGLLLDSAAAFTPVASAAVVLVRNDLTTFDYQQRLQTQDDVALGVVRSRRSPTGRGTRTALSATSA
jgi:hypothetical protein